MRLHVHELGAGPPLVCLHGVTSTGSHFRRLAERVGRRVLAPDLRGHGESGWDPPWNLETHVEDVLESLPAERMPWLGHSFGGRVAYEIAARDPGRVERLVLLDPVVTIAPHVGLWGAENARPDRSYATFEEAVARRWDESMLGPKTDPAVLEEELRGRLFEDEDGRWRYRYAQSAVVAAWGEMTREAPPFERVRVPTLLVLGRESYLSYDGQLEPHRAALGDLLEVAVVDGGHSLLWDGFDETADAIARFLAG